MILRSAIFWNITQRVVLIPHRHFGTDRLSGISWNLRLERIGYPETSVRNCHYSLRNIPEGRSLELRKNDTVFIFVQTRAMRVCRTGGMASCILNFGDVWEKNVTFKARSFVPAVRIAVARKTGVGGGGRL